MAKKKKKPSTLLGKNKVQTPMREFVSNKNMQPRIRPKVKLPKYMTELPKKRSKKKVVKKVVTKKPPVKKKSIKKVVMTPKKLEVVVNPIEVLGEKTVVPGVVHNVKPTKNSVQKAVIVPTAKSTPKQKPPRTEQDVFIKQQSMGYCLFRLADEEGLTVRDTIKHSDLLAKIGLTLETCTNEIVGEAMALTTQADNQIKAKEQEFNRKD